MGRLQAWPLLMTCWAGGNSKSITLPTQRAAHFVKDWGGWPSTPTSYEHALELVRQEPERRFLESRLRELQA